jgi:hypothetical protein
VALLGDEIRGNFEHFPQGSVVDRVNLHLLFSSGELLPLDLKVLAPMVRILDSSALLTNRIAIRGMAETAWRITRDGQTTPSFGLGDSIADVLVTQTKVIATYTDEGIFGSSTEGVVAFNRDGSRSFEYHATFGYEQAQLYDCYCACPAPDGRIAVCPYGDNPSFPLLLIDVERRTREVIPTPELLHGPTAMTLEDDNVLFWSTYKDKTGVYEWRIGADHYERVGEHEGHLRGLPGGRFLNIRPNGFAIVQP